MVQDAKTAVCSRGICAEPIVCWKPHAALRKYAKGSVATDDFVSQVWIAVGVFSFTTKHSVLIHAGPVGELPAQ